MQQVSSTPSTRADVIQLKESLDTKLQQRRAGQLGICPIRSELYSQCFGKGSFQRTNVSVGWAKKIEMDIGKTWCYYITLFFL